MTSALGSAPTGRDDRRTRTTPTRAHRFRWARAAGTGWLYVLPALVMYAVFVLRPLVLTLQYSLYDWNGIGVARWVGLDNYLTVFTDSDLLKIIGNAIVLIVFFSFIPVALGLLVASMVRRITTGAFGTVVRTILFLPQVIPLVAAGIAWSWLLSSNGLVNQALRAVGLGGVARAWLGDFDTALPAVGVIGAWVLLGLCTILLVTGMSKIDPALYEAARLDGAGPVREFLAVTLPSLRQEIGVCLTVTIIAALASFDIVYISTSGGPGLQTTVPGLEIYRLAFSQRQVGLASALAVVLMLLVLACVLPIQRLSRGEKP
ncbi:carbohydrate ABC transporter permease [Micromonospora saelicesensis]|uniref:Carbohydrate ABC transporter membrane protein 1, CUT1 family n=1 Tax=Micromonospora saelicesensis TaxID=285676 RepID=A0A1C4XJ04_9ACTN|nr:sugar ABC transporter permease [Micromonospora saelicesensis]RAO00179.1 Lactose transport system permease protein LacF [Micromonospora saelicesensis]RAO47634.1 Lactose transport system permease protein LacF [Micromonospora saelicesensis]RAO60783.1 Lactose transport system permease protein LacF [Micromonospora saelicesensis]RAO62647.1 Lactose transport system permease protein LacF [Micromonospora saelicesensis]SCF08403.1 carbohydrate ABC transporter membrane protein 1, CUT1 family [Micromono